MLIAIVLTAVGIAAVILSTLLTLIGGATIDLNSLVGGFALVFGAGAMGVMALLKTADEPVEQ